MPKFSVPSKRSASTLGLGLTEDGLVQIKIQSVNFRMENDMKSPDLRQEFYSAKASVPYKPALRRVPRQHPLKGAKVGRIFSK